MKLAETCGIHIEETAKQSNLYSKLENNWKTIGKQNTESIESRYGYNF